jgi:hypothetical protein
MFQSYFSQLGIFGNGGGIWIRKIVKMLDLNVLTLFRSEIVLFQLPAHICPNGGKLDFVIVDFLLDDREVDYRDDACDVLGTELVLVGALTHVMWDRLVAGSCLPCLSPPKTNVTGSLGTATRGRPATNRCLHHQDN